VATDTKVATELTVTAAAPVFPSMVAVILALPPPTAVTTPVAETVATEEDDVSQATDRPASGLPTSPRAIVVSRNVSPTTSVKTVGMTATDSTVDDGPNASSSSHAARNSTASAMRVHPEVRRIGDSEAVATAGKIEDSDRLLEFANVGSARQQGT